MGRNRSNAYLHLHLYSKEKRSYCKRQRSVVGSKWALEADSPNLQIPKPPFAPCTVWTMLFTLAQLDVQPFQQKLLIHTF